jgi:hypothetical protein
MQVDLGVLPMHAGDHDVLPVMLGAGDVEHGEFGEQPGLAQDAGVRVLVHERGSLAGVGERGCLPVVQQEHESRGTDDIPGLMPSMQWVWELQPMFDQWIDGMEDDDGAELAIGEEVAAEVVDGEKEEELMMDVGEEVVVEEDGEMSGYESGSTDPRAWTERCVNPADMAGYEHDDAMHDWLAYCRLTQTQPLESGK